MTRLLLAAAAALAIATPASPSAFTQEHARSIVADVEKVVTGNGIDQQMPVNINGTKQWITVRGRDKRNPILLFIHGGPAAPEMPTSWTFQNPWEDYFTVVQWDQRGAGKTYTANDPANIATTITLPQMVADTEAMVQYLRATYHKPKIFVLGHSWGSLLGIILAHEHPEWLYAYVGIGQMIDSPKSERLDYLTTLGNAKVSGNAQAVKELTALEPYPERDGSIPRAKLDNERKWSVRFGGLSWRRDNYAYYFHAGELSPDYTDADLDAIDKGSLLSLRRLGTVFATFNYSDVTDFRCPIVLFEGRHDFTTSSEVSAAWFARLRAPYKKIIWFENSAHMAQIEEPGRVLVHLVQDVLPLAIHPTGSLLQEGHSAPVPPLLKVKNPSQGHHR